MVWQIIFFPSSGERNSPQDFILDLNPKEQASILRNLKSLSMRDFASWREFRWLKKFKGEIYQITAGPYRLMCCLDGHMIVVVHAFRKKTQKTPKKEISRAESHCQKYRESKGR